MDCEVRKVPGDWEHPKDQNGEYQPLLNPLYYNHDMQDWNYAKAVAEERGTNFEITKPDLDKEYMPEWTEGQATHYQMYETTSEGTPISPVMESPEMLANWLVENKVNAVAFLKASYDDWLQVCRDEAVFNGLFDRKTLEAKAVEEDRTSLKEEYQTDLYYRLQLRADAIAERGDSHEQDNGRDRD